MATCLLQVAAYRERFNVQGLSAVGSVPPQTALAQFAHYSRLVSQLSSPSPVTPAAQLSNHGADTDALNLPPADLGDSPSS